MFKFRSIPRPSILHRLSPPLRSTRHGTIGEAPPHDPACVLITCCPASHNLQAVFRSEPRADGARFSCSDLHIPNVHVLAASCSAVISPTTARIFLMPSTFRGHRSRGIRGGRTAACTRSGVVQGRAQVALLMVTLGQSRLGVPNEPLRCQITVVVPAGATRRDSRWLCTWGAQGDATHGHFRFFDPHLCSTGPSGWPSS